MLPSERGPSRTLAQPLVPGEVLLSTLGSSFRTAYVDHEVPKNTFPSDGWVRVRFRETPAAARVGHALLTARAGEQTR